MNGIHDMGGMHGFGPVVAEPDEPWFHAEWERRAFALTLAMGFTGQWNIDASRHARESLPPAQYLSSSYYEIWHAGLETLLRECGLVTAQELADEKVHTEPRPLERILAARDVAKVLARGGPAARETNAKPRFAVGERIRAIVANPAGHTRLPRYARGRPGTVERLHGSHVFPDSNAHGLGEAPQWLYGVRFDAADLWGADADPRDAVHIDLWEPHLERA
jgi:nitrile hydratase